MSLRKEHWLMLILCATALLWYQFRTPLANLIASKVLTTEQIV